MLRKRSQSTLLLSILFVVMFAACIFAVIHALKPMDTSGYMKVTVHPGDTLWMMAVKYDEGGDPTAFIKWVEDVNHVRAENIQPGDQLVIPVKEEINHLSKDEVASR